MTDIANWLDSGIDQEEDGYPISEYDLTISPNDFNVKTLYDFIESGVISIPEFQRSYVWDIKRASKLIESILLGLPIPQIYLYEESKNKFLVIDGQQRLMSLYYFIKKRFPRMEKRAELRARLKEGESRLPDTLLEDDTYFTRFSLKLPTGLPDITNKFNNLNYATLDEYVTDFHLRTFRTVIIKQNKPDDDDSSIYEIFNRLNTGGVNLKPQEIRTSLYHSNMYNMLYRVNRNTSWRRFLNQPDQDLHKADVEILLRSVALLLEGNTYTPSMIRFLNNFSKKCKQIQESKIEILEKAITSFFDACESLESRIFYNDVGRFSIPIFESVFVAFLKPSLNEAAVPSLALTNKKIQKLKDDPEFKNATMQRTSSTTNVKKRIERAQSILSGQG